MKQFYQEKIKKITEKITFFEKMLSEEKKELERCKACLKDCEIDEKIENYKKKLLEENNEKEQ